MMDEAAGKILGMAMAYGVSALGLFLAYVSYRRRTVGAERVMTPLAWGVVATVLVVLAGGVVVVARLAEAPAPPPVEAPEAAAEYDAPAPAASPEAAPPLGVAPPSDVRQPPEAATRPARARWPLLGMLLPALIFLVATWISVAMYLHFSRSGP